MRDVTLNRRGVLDEKNERTTTLEKGEGLGIPVLFHLIFFPTSSPHYSRRTTTILIITIARRHMTCTIMLQLLLSAAPAAAVNMKLSTLKPRNTFSSKHL
mmetsp:Transcript_513/g.743  ORF Transcript_513/g.743 Transcript_513/m.743 type:complete len:100 (+) Transcript_513:666-965(+)